MSTSTLVNSPAFQEGIANSKPERLIDHIATLTATPPYRLEKGRRSGRDVMPKTQFLTPAQWDAWVHEIQRDGERLDGDMEKAKRELERMNGDAVEAAATSRVDSATATELSA